MQVEPAAAPAIKRKRALGLVAASHASQHMYSGLLPLTYPAILIAFHLNYATLGLAVGVIGVVGGLTQATAGFVGRRVAARWILGGQNLVVGLCSIVQGLAPAYFVFAAGQGLGSLASSQQHPVGSAVATRLYPERRGTALSVATIGGSIGSLVVPIPAALLISAWGWRPTLLLMSIPLMVMSLILLLTFPPVPREHRVAPAAGAPRFQLPHLSRSQFIDPKVAVFAILAGTVAAGGRGLGTLNAYIPLYLRNGAHLSELTVGVIFNLVLLGAVVGPLVGGPLSDRFGRVPVLWTAYGLSAVAVFALGQATHLPVAALAGLGLVVGLVAYVENPLLQALLSDGVTAQAQSAIFGLYFAISYGVGSLWIIGVGQAIQHLGFGTGFTIMAGSYLGAAALLVPCYRGAQRARHA
ncbi:MAG: MFS transporter [Candidatus Dormibacteraeota bacterium]|nr:MFS transporter [Candidatus Dormibacteraeota bacterium]